VNNRLGGFPREATFLAALTTIVTAGVGRQLSQAAAAPMPIIYRTVSALRRFYWAKG